MICTLPIGRRALVALVTLVTTLVFALSAGCTRASLQLAAQTTVAKPNDGASKPEVIYGVDNRVDLFEETDPSLKVLSESIVALMSKAQIGPEQNGLRAILGTNYGSSLGLCKDEKFYEQNTAAFCSGFLVAPDVVVTAGHCIADLKVCSETSFAFGFAMTAPGQMPTALPAQDVYSCQSIVHRQSPTEGADFAIVKLDRPVKNRLPLVLRANGAIAQRTDVTVLGYPEGLPLKIAGGAKVRKISSPDFFVANTDTYGGNSGSAVINSATHEVEGVLVRGAKDFVWTKDGCARSYRCLPDACRGEDVTRISEVIKLLPTQR